MSFCWTESLRAELANLFHLGRTALADKKPTRHDLKCWAAEEFAKKHQEVSSCAAYKELCRQEAWRYLS